MPMLVHKFTAEFQFQKKKKVTTKALLSKKYF